MLCSGRLPPRLFPVNEEVVDYGAVFSWAEKDGPVAALAGGTVVYLSTSQHVPTVDGHTRSDANGMAETHQVEYQSLPMMC